MTDTFENVEAGFMRAYADAAPAASGPATTRLGGGVVLAMRRDPNGYWNKALGFTEPITGALIDEILAFWRTHGTTRATLQLRPEALPDDWAEICAARGIEDSGGRIVKLSCPIGETIPAGPDDLDVRPVTEADAPDWAAVILDAFGFEHEGQAEMFLGTVGDPRFRPFAIWADGRIVGGANLYLDGEVAGLNADGTVAGFRRRGAQSALVAARIAAAREAGCRWVVAETGWSDATPRHSSLNNMKRAGLRPNYIRPSWRWTAA